MLCEATPDTSLLWGSWFDWLVALSLITAAFFHFLINRDPAIRESRSLVAARWVLFAGLSGLGTRCLYVLLTGKADILMTTPTNLGLFAVGVSQICFGLYTFNKHHRSSFTPVSPVSERDE